MRFSEEIDQRREADSIGLIFATTSEWPTTRPESSRVNGLSSDRSRRLDSSRLARMRIELDHVFVCTAPGAPEAEEFVRFGLREGPPNRHPGQGTANRRFAFANAMIELLWVDEAEEAQSECSRRTQLWERWSGRESRASPF